MKQVEDTNVNVMPIALIRRFLEAPSAPNTLSHARVNLPSLARNPHTNRIGGI